MVVSASKAGGELTSSWRLMHRGADRLVETRWAIQTVSSSSCGKKTDRKRILAWKAFVLNAVVERREAILNAALRGAGNRHRLYGRIQGQVTERNSVIGRAY